MAAAKPPPSLSGLSILAPESTPCDLQASKSDVRGKSRFTLYHPPQRVRHSDEFLSSGWFFITWNRSNPSKDLLVKIVISNIVGRMHRLFVHVIVNIALDSLCSNLRRTICLYKCYTSCTVFVFCCRLIVQNTGSTSCIGFIHFRYFQVLLLLWLLYLLAIQMLYFVFVFCCRLIVQNIPDQQVGFIHFRYFQVLLLFVIFVPARYSDILKSSWLIDIVVNKNM